MVAFNEQILASQRPNFFELLAQEAMREALRPAFEYVCKVLVHSNPEILHHLWRFCDEIYLVLESLLQLYFVINHGGSFSEHFYCLIRRGPCRNGTLGAREKLLSLLCLTVVPYLVVKMDRLYLHLQEENDAMRITWNSGKGPKSLGKLLYFVIYPYIQSLWNGMKFIFRLRYLFGQTEYYSPLLWFAGVTLSRDLANEQSSPLSVDSLWRRVVNSALPISVFALKLIEWWYSTERSAAVRMMTSLPIPPPPPHTQPNEDGVRLPQNPQLCPLCVKRRVDPTVIATSGYVFCYSCIMGYLRMHKECPITCIPTSEQQLIRLYQLQNT